MNYIDLSRGGVMVSASGNALPVAERLHFVDAQTQNFAFTFWKCGVVWEIPAGAALVMVGNPTENSTTAVFYATGAIAADRKSVTFAVDTYTVEYFAAITRSGTALYVDIIMATGDGPADSVRLARIDAIADVRVLKPGATPPPAIEGRDYVCSVEEIPEPTAELAGRVLVYTGETTASFKHGSSYYCNGESWAEIGGGGAVDSVNGKTGVVVLDASDVGAIPLPAITPLTAVSGTVTVSAVHGAIYTYTLTGSETVTPGTAPAGQAATFELWLTQPATAVAVAFPANIYWGIDNNFAADNPPPAFDAGGRTYCITFRWDGTRYLANLNYVVAGGAA